MNEPKKTPEIEIIHDTLEEAESSAEKNWAESWTAHALKMQQNAPEHFENAAKFLAGLVSICLTLFVKINDTAFANTEFFVWIGLGVILWLTSIVLSFFVFFPFTYSYFDESPKQIEDACRDIVRTKKRYLRFATIAFLLGLIILTWVFLSSLI